MRKKENGLTKVECDGCGEMAEIHSIDPDHIGAVLFDIGWQKQGEAELCQRCAGVN